MRFFVHIFLAVALAAVLQPRAAESHLIVRHFMTFDDAQSFCVARGWRVSIITDESIQETVASMALHSLRPGLKLWIGLKYYNQTNQWKHTNCQPAVYTNWKIGSPAMGEEGDCVAAETSTGEWLNYPCDRKFPFICDPSANHPAECKITSYDGYELNINFGAWYKYIDTGAKTWNQADRECKEDGGYLVSIMSEAESNYVFTLSSAYFWIGLSYLNSTKAMWWTDKSGVNYTKMSTTHFFCVPEHPQVLCGLRMANVEEWCFTYCDRVSPAANIYYGAMVCKRKLPEYI